MEESASFYVCPAFTSGSRINTATRVLIPGFITLLKRSHVTSNSARYWMEVSVSLNFRVSMKTFSIPPPNDGALEKYQYCYVPLDGAMSQDQR